MNEPRRDRSAATARLAAGCLLLALAGAAAFRLPRLGQRPMHADEAVQAARSRDLWQRGRYRYDPHEFHGPTLPYATLPSLWLSGADSFAATTKTTYRIVPALFGIGALVLLWLLADGLGRPAVAVAAVLWAISPAMVFYSRYYIHETLLSLFTLAAVGAVWRYVRGGKLRWCLAAGAFVGLMQATKETSIISCAAAAIGLGAMALWGRLWREEDRTWHAPGPAWHGAAALAMALFVAVLLLSSLLTNARGPLDGVLTYLPWLRRAGGSSPHLHPCYYYLRMLAWWRADTGPIWSEGLILVLAAIGFAAALAPGAKVPSGASVRFVRWLGFTTLASTALYSTIPYKTPWCVVQFLGGMILLAGVGGVVLVRVVPTRALKALTVLLLLAAAGQLGWQSYRASYLLAADPANPYVHTPTRPKFEQLAQQIDALAEAWPDRRDFSIWVLWHDQYYWPLPWYLRRYGPIGRLDRVPDGPAPAVIVASAEFNPELARRLDGTHQMPSFYEMRPGVFVVLWVRKDVWRAHLERLNRL
ncbi:MAG: TIGR03663 family protein [Pirellulales bacterium]|nr:TIGR03663 family protein [Pirellulales bacterium]